MPPSPDPNFQGTYFSQWPPSFDEFKETRIASVRIEDIPTRLEQKQHRVWYIWAPNSAIVTLTGPLKESIQIADMLYTLDTHLHQFSVKGDERAELDNAFIRLMELWLKFEEILCYWAKKEMPQMPEADASDGLHMIEEARFVPILTRFWEALDTYSRPPFVEELKEFIKKTTVLIKKLKEMISEKVLS